MNKTARSTFLSLVFVLLGWLTAGTAHAEKADRDKPTNIEANQMFYDESKQTNTFVGNVVLTRGTLVMNAEKLLIRQDAAGYQYATMLAVAGGVAKFRQKRDGGKDMWIEGFAADRIEYDTKTDVAKLYKNAKVKMLEGTRATDEVEGEFISYDSRTEFYTVSGSVSADGKPTGGRIRAIIQPRTQEKQGDDK